MLSVKDKKKLLEIARESIRSYLENRERPSFDIEEKELRQKRGAFVTLNINGRLRGCIGRIIADKSLYETISQMAIQAAFYDPRFPQLREEEFKNVEIEISILSELKKIEDIKEIKVGTDGILIKKGYHQGLLLPQVATEYSWNRKTFLEHTCLKADLNKDAWDDKDTEIYIFSAEVFLEGELKNE